MPALFLQPAPTFTTEQQSQGREWVVSGSTRTRSDLTTKLLFNEAVPASASNRATRVQPPGPIVIEKLLPLPEEHEKVDSTRSSITFTALSEERLQAAVELAKRDLRRRHLESSKKIPAKPPEDASLLETSDVELLEELAATPRKLTLKASSPKEKKVRRAKQTSQKRSVREKPWTGHSPPTRDPSQRQLEAGKEAFLSQQIHKLHNELEVYIQKVEELANRGNKMEELLDPEEEEKLERRRQKQAALTARKIYVLQQQVKEIQDDMEKQKSQKMWDNKQSTAVNKLAATHRGTLRALQDVIHQLSEPSLRTIPPHYKELGQLIRRLSMCSAKVKVDQGSDVPEMAINILQKLEILDSALRKQEILEKVQVQTHLSHGAFPRHSQSPARVFKDPRSSNVWGTWKPTNPIKAHGRRMFSQKPKATSHQPMNRRGGLRSNLESLAQLSWLRELQGRPEPNAPHRKARHPERRKSNLTMKCKQIQDPGFQQPTVSSQLRVNKLPEKVHSFPWIPPSPHSPPPKGLSPQKGRAEPRCLFSPEKTSASSPKRNTAGGSGTKPVLSSEWKNQAQNEALRIAWLDKMTVQRLKELNQLSKEEAERIQTLRYKVMSPTQWAERAEQKARERIQPLLDEAQIGESRSRIGFSLRNKQSVQAAERAAERLSEDLLEGLREDATRTAWTAETDDQVGGSAQCRLQAPTLESMLLRMEEIQRDQEEVRRRFASITYSDPPGWDQTGAMGPQCHASGSRAASPQPIRFTRPVLKQTSAAEIVLEKPMETGFLSEDSLTEERPQDEQPPRNSAVFPGPAERGSGTVISVPSNTLRNIRRYREDFDSYLCVVAHEAVGSFSPWAVADSLAEELLSEALADVAAEFQDVVEEYAEAVFTSEFLQPIQPHPGPAAALEA